MEDQTIPPTPPDEGGGRAPRDYQLDLLEKESLIHFLIQSEIELISCPFVFLVYDEIQPKKDIKCSIMIFKHGYKIF